jgi:hypothetical protein
MQALRGEEVEPLHILNLGTRWGWVVSVTPRPRFTHMKGVPTRWASELVWTQRLEQKSLASVGNRTPVVQSVVRHYTDWAVPAPTAMTHGDITVFWSQTSLQKIFNGRKCTEYNRQRFMGHSHNLTPLYSHIPMTVPSLTTSTRVSGHWRITQESYQT